MRLVCPNCASQYEVDESLFPEEGREVQCSNCEEVWMQYPVEEQEPIRLDPLSRVEDDYAPAAQRPSDRLGAEERGALAAAVREEITALGGATRDRDDRTGRAAAKGGEEDDDILASLRAQIAMEGGDFEKGGSAKSQKRNLRVAAESVGIKVDEDHEEEQAAQRRKWNLSDGKDTPAPSRKAPKRKDEKVSRALRQYDHEVSDYRPRRGMRRGFILGLLLVAIGAGIYTMRTEFAEAYPPAGPYLDQFATSVDDGRRQAEALYTEYSPRLRAQIDRLTGGGGDEG